VGTRAAGAVPDHDPVLHRGHRQPLAARRGRRLGRARPRLRMRTGCCGAGLPPRAPAGTIGGAGTRRRAGPQMTAPHQFHDEEHLALAFDAGRLGLWSWNALTDEITWDHALQERFGLPLSSSTLTFAQYLELIHPDDREHTTSTVEEA